MSLQKAVSTTQGFPMVLGAQVRARRISLGLNQADVADLAGVSERFIRFVEQGKPTIQLEPLLAVLGTLGLELAIRYAHSPAASQPPASQPSSGQPSSSPGLP